MKLPIRGRTIAGVHMIRTIGKADPTHLVLYLEDEEGKQSILEISTDYYTDRLYVDLKERARGDK